MLCFASLIVFSILSVFSAKYRWWLKEAFKCTFRKVTFRKCEANFEERMRAKVSFKLLRFPVLAKVWRKYYEVFSGLFILLFFISLLFAVNGAYGLVTNSCETSFQPLLELFGLEQWKEVNKVSNPKLTIKIVEACLIIRGTGGEKGVGNSSLDKLIGEILISSEKEAEIKVKVSLPNGYLSGSVPKATPLSCHFLQTKTNTFMWQHLKVNEGGIKYKGELFTSLKYEALIKTVSMPKISFDQGKLVINENFFAGQPLYLVKIEKGIVSFIPLMNLTKKQEILELNGFRNFSSLKSFLGNVLKEEITNESFSKIDQEPLREVVSFFNGTISRETGKRSFFILISRGDETSEISNLKTYSEIPANGKISKLYLIIYLFHSK